MRRWFRKYAQAIKQRDEQLANLAEETGGRIFIPTSTEEILTQADKISRDIRAQYVITYAPKRAFANEGGRERRSIEVFARRAGLEVFSLRNRVIIPLP
jgi:acyl-CoA reductase-like NAD-dependent aldehyde dehydrogenase